MQIKFTEGSDEDGLGVPYPQEIDSELHNLGYFDLKKEPHRIVEIEELKNWPEFRQFIEWINERDGFFKSLRCDLWIASMLPDAKFKCIAVGYITIAFEILELNTSKQPYETFRQRFKEYAAAYPQSEQTNFELKHIPTSYINHGIPRGWSEDVEIHGLGNTDEEAAEAWFVGMRVFEDFLVEENAISADQLKQEKKDADIRLVQETVSQGLYHRAHRER
jgi:hypothetical protein